MHSISTTIVTGVRPGTAHPGAAPPLGRYPNPLAVSSQYALPHRRHRRHSTAVLIAAALGTRHDDTLRLERDRLQQCGFDLRKTSTFTTAGLPSPFVAGVQYSREQLNGQRFLTNDAPTTLGLPELAFRQPLL